MHFASKLMHNSWKIHIFSELNASCLNLGRIQPYKSYICIQICLRFSTIPGSFLNSCYFHTSYPQSGLKWYSNSKTMNINEIIRIQPDPSSVKKKSRVNIWISAFCEIYAFGWKHIPAHNSFFGFRKWYAHIKRGVVDAQSPFSPN